MLTRHGLATYLADLVSNAGLGPTQFLFMMAALLLVLGTVLEGYSIILITLPLTLPILHALSIDPVHYAIVMTIGIELGMLTPPVGLNLFVMAFGISIGVGMFMMASAAWPSFSIVLEEMRRLPEHMSRVLSF